MEALQRQQDLEQDMIERGRAIFFRTLDNLRAQGLETVAKPQRDLITKILNPFSEAIRTHYDTLCTRRGRKPEIFYALQTLEIPVVAFLTVRKVLESVSDCVLLQSVCVAVGQDILLEQQLSILEQEHYEKYEEIQRNAKNIIKRKTRIRQLKKACSDGRQTPNNDKELLQKAFHIGHALIQCLIQSTPFFAIVREPYKTVASGFVSTAYRLELTATCHAWLDRHINAVANLFPDYLPCLIPPKPWTSLYCGGYHFLKKALPFVKTTCPIHLEALENAFKNGVLKETTRAVNALQETAWAVNIRVLNVIERLWNDDAIDKQNSNLKALNLPIKPIQSLPPCPVCATPLSINDHKRHACFKDMDTASRKQWMRNAESVSEQNRSMLSRRLAMTKTLAMAQRFCHEERIYYPYQLDFRGRIYSVPTGLSPQGDDLAKGLLHFAEAQPLKTKEAVQWLAIHGANTFGYNKHSLVERHAWVIENQKAILAVAAAPLENMWWMQAESPFCFLAFCFEWAAHCQTPYQSLSRIPVAMDGSCNGLQLFALLLKDEKSGQAVNLVPAKHPADIYGHVANNVRHRIQKDLLHRTDRTRTARSGKTLYNVQQCASILQNINIDRSMTKRPVMILPYGGTRQACRTHTQMWLKEHLSKAQLTDINNNTYGLSLYLSEHIWEAMDDSVSAARKTMDFLQKMASVLSQHNMPLRWTSPCGLPIVQAYRKRVPYAVVTRIGDKLFKYTLRSASSTLDTRRQRQAIAPNFIHALDAAALVRTVNRCLIHNVTTFAMIHDSYATHANNATLLARELREAFIELFDKQNPLQTFYEEIQQDLLEHTEKTASLPTLPQYGTLRVSELRHAAYFFA